MSSATLYCGDALTVLRSLPEASVQCCVTSPPYWGLRDYGTPGQLGLERTPEEYVKKMVAVFGEVRRVLRDDGTFWLNMGDGYASAWPAPNTRRNIINNPMSGGKRGPQRQSKLSGHLKEKDLIGMPWRLAFALQADGWWLRSDIIWSKPNPMPESVTDRPTKAHEYVFLLSKSAAYYYDAAAIASGSGAARNARSVWEIATQRYPLAHFAMFPEELARRCILAGTSAKACEACRAPWERTIERTTVEQTGVTPKQAEYRAQGLASTKSTIGRTKAGRTKAWGAGEGSCRSTGWQPTCNCEPAINIGVGQCVVLDPFGGSGTVAQVATGNRRDSIYIDLNPKYLELAQQRIGPLLTTAAP